MTPRWLPTGVLPTLALTKEASVTVYPQPVFSHIVTALQNGADRWPRQSQINQNHLQLVWPYDVIANGSSGATACAMRPRMKGA